MKKVNGRGKQTVKKMKVKGVVQELTSRIEQRAEVAKNDLAALSRRRTR